MTQKVVAVFGPSGPNTLSATAVALGTVIATKNTLLTGGTGILDQSVKEQAIDGAKKAIKGKSSGRWIGVPQAGRPTQPPPLQRGFLITTPYHHERNYLNTFLCDSAIALKGGPGTDSEMAFCVVLGRPVVLLGPGWEQLEHQLRQPANARAAVAAMIDRMFPPAALGNRPIDQAIRASRAATSALGVMRVDSVSGFDVTEAVTRALQPAGGAHLSETASLLDPDLFDLLLRWLEG